MERNYYTEGFESFLKEKSDEYKLYPSEKVWNNINQKLHPTAQMAFPGCGITYSGYWCRYQNLHWTTGTSRLCHHLKTKQFLPILYDELNKPATSQNKKMQVLFKSKTNTVPKPRLGSSESYCRTAFFARQESSLFAVPSSEYHRCTRPTIHCPRTGWYSIQSRLTNHV